ncbi:hypothetical protein BDAP_000767, partial [Binucleata daphniae]
SYCKTTKKINVPQFGAIKTKFANTNIKIKPFIITQINFEKDCIEKEVKNNLVRSILIEVNFFEYYFGAINSILNGITNPTNNNISFTEGYFRNRLKYLNWLIGFKWFKPIDLLRNVKRKKNDLIHVYILYDLKINVRDYMVRMMTHNKLNNPLLKENVNIISDMCIIWHITCIKNLYLHFKNECNDVCEFKNILQFDFSREQPENDTNLSIIQINIDEINDKLIKTLNYEDMLVNNMKTQNVFTLKSTTPYHKNKLKNYNEI